MNQILTWQQNNQIKSSAWVSESEFSPPKQILLADDTLKADQFYTAASQGAAYIYTGDFQNAKQLLQAIQRRIDKSSRGKVVDSFHRYRQSQAHRAQLLARLLICIESDLSIQLRRAPNVAVAIREALDESARTPNGFVVSLRELLGYIGAHEWRKKGVFVPALEATIHPYYGIFSPSRGEYLDLIAAAPLPGRIDLALDVGTGSGVIAALLAKRGVKHIVATDISERALACATENIDRLGFAPQVEFVKANLFTEGKADLIVCNPPWVPARPTSAIERAVYDEDGRMLRDFLLGVGHHLSDSGEAWLIMSDLAEHLGLRPQDELTNLIEKGGLRVIDTLSAKPKHAKAQDADDPLHAARSKEITKLWRLVKK